MRNIFFAALFALSACTANAELVSIDVVQNNNADTPAGFIVNDILIGFTGQLFGQQMIVELDSGSLYQDGFGGETAPTDALLVPFPALASDTFLTMGGTTAGTSEDTLVVGASTELGGGGIKIFDETGIDVAWAPAPGVVVEDGIDFITARVTLSDDANGATIYFGNAGAQGGVIIDSGRIENGVLSFIPEPSTALLAGLALVGFAARRK